MAALNGEMSRPHAIADVSRKLRQMAINKGEEIPDNYRNENGIHFQMLAMESAWLGRTVLMKPATKLFKEVVVLHRDEPAEYAALLKSALLMV